MEEKAYIELVDKRVKNNWFFRGRDQIIRCLIKKYATNANRALDIGIGGGGDYLIDVARDLDCEIFVIDREPIALEIAKNKGVAKNLILADCQQLPFKKNSFFLILALDVLEHIEDDDKALGEISRVLEDKGLFLLIVPAYKWLFSNWDKYYHHKRRYYLLEILDKICSRGFSILYMNYFNFLMFPIFVLQSIYYKFCKNVKAIPNIPEAVNKILIHFFHFEIRTMQYLRLPYGSSLVICGVKETGIFKV